MDYATLPTLELIRQTVEAVKARGINAEFVETKEEGAWVEPGLYCTVSFLERTRNGLRAPVFVELLEET